ncbi:hypothetical protein GCM10023184_44850 [Flaviaesturariibacter amylovorans]|uniref:Gliding motility-associated C-terminal domain-containing protein n=1 Tax=Flaviaesturariibacter amylovorans TaxID=1084520 RepID=A0ABP8HT45_9BACT
MLFFFCARGQNDPGERELRKRLDSLEAMSRGGHPRKGILQTSPGSLPGRSAPGARSGSTICGTTPGRILIRETSGDYIVGDPVPCSDGTLLLTGVYASNTPPYPAMGFLMKMRDNGDVIWKRRYDSLGHVAFSYIGYSKVLELRDGSLLLAGATGNAETGNQNLLFTKVDGQGNLLWSRCYLSRFWRPGGTGSNDHFALQQIRQDSVTGAVYFCGSFWSDGVSLAQIDVANGDLVWSMAYDFPVSGFQKVFGFEILQSELLLFGKLDDFRTLVLAMRVGKSDGGMLGMKAFLQAGTNTTRSDFLGEEPVVRHNNGNYLITGKCYGTSIYFPPSSQLRTHAAVLELSPDLNIIQAYAFRNTVQGDLYNTDVSITPEGSGLFTMHHFISSYTSDWYGTLFGNGGAIQHRRVRHYNATEISTERKAIRRPDGSMLNVRLISDSATMEHYMEMQRLQAFDPSSDCLGQLENVTVVEPLTYQNYAWSSQPVVQANAFQYAPNKTITVSGLPAGVVEPGCVQVSFCDSLNISVGTGTVCVGQTVRLQARRNPGCGNPVTVQWPAGVGIPTTVNDSTWDFQFTAPFEGYFHASVQGCVVIRDSVQVRALQAPASLDLGPDRELCPGNSIVLSAGPGYASYAWQDGTSAPTFLVTTPGSYWVHTVTGCGDHFYDTVRITPHGPIPFSAGPDRQLCAGDTVRLEAQAGFISYAWTNNYQISSLSSAQVLVSPRVDTAYFVRGELTPGCFAYDTVRIRVHLVPPLSLGPDGTLCRNDVRQLDAGSGFVSYLWSNGATGQTIAIQSAGDFSVAATTAHGCVARDTMRLTAIHPLPSPAPDRSPTICAGTTRLLDPGTFSSYLWSNGSTNRTIDVSGTGTWWVRVTDGNGCSAADTIRITTVTPLPRDFLPSDTFLCQYGSVELRSVLSFSRYHWNTGLTTPSLRVSGPGTYWLDATNAQGCTGRDTIAVQAKSCMKGLFVPTAFTPGRDGRNDQLRGLLFGTVVSYEFVIYNRWGERVFATHSPGRGWDGRLRNVDQDMGVFVWSCLYQLAGEPARMEKGTFLLIR